MINLHRVKDGESMFLNTIEPYEKYKVVVEDTYFVDKTALLEELIPALGKENRFFCITRPRRFGKTIMANMAGAFFGRAADGRDLFNRLEISGFQAYQAHLNRHNVIYIDFSNMPENCGTYIQYIERIIHGLKDDLLEEYPDVVSDSGKAVWDILSEIFQKTRQRFIFIMDEWDAVFHMPFITEKEQEQYLLFLKMLLKSKVYVELAYMTGILPIAKYSDGLELNMFVEYGMATSERFSGYFGFLDKEVDTLLDIYKKTTESPRLSRSDLRDWYDGYHTAAGDRLYNPRSIVCALENNQIKNYWTSSGVYDSIIGYVKDNVADIRDDLAILFAGGSISADVQEYAAVSRQLETKDEIYSAMVVYGLLTYENGEVMIPNRELVCELYILSGSQK